MAMNISSMKHGARGVEEGSGSHEDRSRCCFQEWIKVQRQDLSHLLHQKSDEQRNEEEIKNLIRSCIAHFEEYISNRRRLAQEEAAPFFSPTWCTSLENSLLWIAGCRPSIFIRLVYALSGCEVEARLLGEWVERMRRSNNNNNNNVGVGELSLRQMERVDGLHMRTIRAEEKLTSEMASCQEEVADRPIAVIANGISMEGIGEVNEEAEVALKDHEKAMRGIMEKADDLRLNTVKEVIDILNPLQAVEFLVASKKLHLSLHLWGKRRDEKQGRTTPSSSSSSYY